MKKFFLSNLIIAVLVVVAAFVGCKKESEDDDSKGNKHGSLVAIGENGNWFIDGIDTGVWAQGVVVAIGENGNWFIGLTRKICGVII